MRGDPELLTKEYAVDFCLNRAMDAAGYHGVGRIYEAVQDIEQHAHILRRCIADDLADESDRYRRILGEYERIAFARDDESGRPEGKTLLILFYTIDSRYYFNGKLKAEIHKINSFNVIKTIITYICQKINASELN